MAIQILEDHVINKIAAGEVVERPASVVKELLENSIDAGATKIDIEIKDYGKELIRIADDGSGMSPADAEIAIQRHSTSKIKDESDLNSIKTLGFRGEALASIAAVSKMVIMTRQHDSIEGYKIVIEGGKLISKSFVGCPQGTTIEVHNLFFNTPARKKFLKSDTNELRSIVDIATRYALYYSNVAFKLVHNGHLLLNTTRSSEMLNSISSVYGSETAKQMLKVEYTDGLVAVSGYISKPSLLKADKTWQNFYVNGRFVKNDTASQALYDAYHTLLFVNKHPVVVLNIGVDHSKVDVNVHPSKDLVKFEQATRVYDAVFNALRKSLQESELIADYSASKPAQAVLKPLEKPLKRRLKHEMISQGNQIRLAVESVKKREDSFEKLPKMRLLGQIAKTYFLAESDDGFLLIDQHVVQERILYEKFMAQLLGKEVAKQGLVKPELVELSPEEKIVAKENVSELGRLGFEIEEFGSNSFMIRTVPTLFSRVQAKELLSEVLQEILDNKRSSVEKLQEEIITRMACRASIKGGDECSIPQMEELLKQLDKTQLPWTCPHGRPIIIKFSREEIEKMFRRKA